MPYVFYDTETTGTETAFDQILQFAAIRTDDDLNELDRFNIRCRLLPHIVPSPGALRLTNILIHVLASITLFALIRTLLMLPRTMIPPGLALAPKPAGRAAAVDQRGRAALVDYLRLGLDVYA